MSSFASKNPGHSGDPVVVVSEVLKEYRITADETPYVAGVSGGPDSMVLLYLLANILKYNIIAVHINYGRRGAESDADESLVRAFCDRHHIELRVFDVRKLSKQDPEQVTKELEKQLAEQATEEPPAGNFQEYARRIRHECMLSVRNEKQARALFLAHQRDDQVETIIQKILRGAAVENWTGMQVVSWPWIRPLLSLGKEELIAYADKQGIPYRTDASNLGSDYARNLLRNKVFPLLSGHFPGWSENILGAARSGFLHRRLLDFVTEQVTDPLTDRTSCHATDHVKEDHPEAGELSKTDLCSEPENRSGKPCPLTLNRTRWLSLPEGIRTAVARHWVRHQTGFAGWSRGMVGRLSDLGHIQTGQNIMIFDRLGIVRDRDRFVLMVNAAESQQGDAINVTILLSHVAEKPVSESGFMFLRSHYRPGVNHEALQLRWDSIPGKLLLRTWRKGDKIRPFGMQGVQSVADHLTHRKISASLKKQTQILASFDGTVYAVLFPHSTKSGAIGTIAEHARCREEGEAVLLIKKNKQDPWGYTYRKP